MTAPWEKEYQTHPLDMRVIVEKDTHEDEDGDGWIVVADLRVPLGECCEVGALLSGAPYMARELRHILRVLEPLEQSGDLDVPGLATLNGAREALRKAGVPLP